MEMGISGNFRKFPTPLWHSLEIPLPYVVARFQDDGVSTTQPGFLDVVPGERLFGASPDLPMDEGFII